MLISRGRFKAMLRDESVAYLNEQPVINSGLIGTNAVTYEKLQLPSTANVLLGVGDPIGSGYAEIACTAFARSILDDPDAATVQATLGLGTSAVYDVGTTVGDIVQLENVGGNPGLPAIDGSQLTGVFTSPATTEGDILVQGAAALERLPKGTSGQILTILNDAVAWADTVAQKDIEHTLWNGGVLTAEVNKHYVVNAQLVTTTATLPEAPPNGSLIAFSDFTGDFATHNLTINSSGTDTIFNGLDQQVVLVNDFDLVGYVYFDGNWSVIKAQVFNSNTLQDIMTTRGDLIYRDNLNQTARLPLGSNGQVLKSNGTDLIWDDGLSAVDLGYSATAAGGTISNSAGLGVNLSLVSGGAAGLMAPSSYTKLLNIEASADVTDTVNVTAAGALMDSEVASLTGIKTLTIPDNVTVSSFAVTLLDNTDAATTRTDLGLGTAAVLDAGTGANELLQLDGSGALPAIDGSNLLNLPSGFENPLTTAGDLIYRDNAANTTRLPIGTNGQVLVSNGTVPTWGDIVTATNLSYTASPTNGTVVSDTGNDATLTLADATNAGLMSPGDFTKLGNITLSGAIDLDSAVLLDGSNRLPAVDGSLLTNLPPGGLTNFTESLNEAAPNSAADPDIRLQATGSATNMDVSISPKGSGSFSLQPADGTSSGGNKRGTYAVDLQLFRTASTQIASGSYSFIAGTSNTVTGDRSAAIGSSNTVSAGWSYAIGNNNTVSGVFSLATGENNTLSARDSFAVGAYNICGGEYSVVGGRQNDVVGNYSIVGGWSNNVDGDYSFVVGDGNATVSNYALSLGFSNTINDTYSIAIGQSNTTTGSYSVAIGRSNTTGDDYSVAMGYEAATGSTLGKFAYASGKSVAVGDAQFCIQVLRGVTNATGTRLLTTDSSVTATAANSLTPPTDSCYALTVRVAGSENGAGNWFPGDWEIKALVENQFGTVTITHQTTTEFNNSMGTATAPVLVVNSDICTVEVTAPGSATTYWVATAQYTQFGVQ